MNVEVAGTRFPNPVLLASGILGSTGESLNRALEHGAGGVVTKSAGTEPRKGYRGPNVFVEDGYALNAVGLSNPGKEFVEEVRKVDGRTIVSIFGGTAQEFAELALHFEDVADCLELNVSCPHAEGYGVDIGADPELTRDVTGAVTDAVDTPVWVKLTPNVTDIKVIGEAAEDAGADAVVAINTIGAMAIDTESGHPILGNVEGGLSGPALKPIAVKQIYELYTALDIPIVGVGGVSSAEDAVELMLAGASLVEVGTAVKDGVEVLDEIAEGIDSYCNERGIKHSELVGKTHRLSGSIL